MGFVVAIRGNHMLDESRLPDHPAISLAGRILFTLIFFLSGVTHFTDLENYKSLIPDAIPFRTFWVLIGQQTPTFWSLALRCRLV